MESSSGHLGKTVSLSTAQNRGICCFEVGLVQLMDLWSRSNAGAVNDIGFAAEMGGSIQTETAAAAEGVVLRVRGDGNVYAMVCTMGKRLTTAPTNLIVMWRVPFR